MTPPCRGRARCSRSHWAASTRHAAAFAPTPSSRAPMRVPAERSRSPRSSQNWSPSGCARMTRARAASIRHWDRSCAPRDTTARSHSSASETRGRSRPEPGADLPSARRAARHRAAHAAGAGRCRARSRGDGQGMVRRSDGRADRSPDECGRARFTRRRHRRCRNAAVDGLADPHRSGPRHAPRRPRPCRRNRRGRPRDVEHDRSALAHRPRRSAPHPRPGDRRARADAVAMRQRGCDQLRRRKRRRHGGDRPRSGGTGLARGACVSRPASNASTARRCVLPAGPTTVGTPRDRHRSARSEGVLVPDARHRHRRIAPADRVGRSRRSDDGALAQSALAALCPRGAAQAPDAAFSRARRRPRADDRRRRLRAGADPGCVHPVRVPLSPRLARPRGGRFRPSARPRPHEPAARADRSSPLATRSLAGVRLLAGRARPCARHR